MHMLGYVFVDEPTETAVEKALIKFHNKEWDWYRCGGRWDGYLQGEEEMKRRQTNDGFNFAVENDDVRRNSCRVIDFPVELKPPYFFVLNGKFIAKERWDPKAANEWSKTELGNMVPIDGYLDLLRKALAANPDKFIIVVDIHN